MKTFSGQYGFVLVLDSDTKNYAANLSEQYPNNLIPINQRIPHLTLFHTSIKNAPIAEVRNMLSGLATDLSMTLTFRDIVSYGGHFVFWQCAKTEELVLLHQKSLALTKYFSPGNDAKKENLILPKEQEENIKRYGHPLVREQWSPHITLAYAEHDPKIVSRTQEYITSPVGISFVKIGVYGSVQEAVLDSSKI